MSTITHGAVRTITNAVPVSLQRIGLQGRTKQLTLINDGPATVVFYWGGGDPNNLPGGWIWDTSDADEKGYVKSGDAILVPGGVRTFLAQVVSGGGNCTLRCVEP